MARTVDPVRHAARRLHIIDAALTCFAATGWEGTTTASICRAAGIGSGTFFHYYPTKTAVMTAIIVLGTAETEELLAEREHPADALAVVLELVDKTVADAAEPRVAGFVQAAIGAFHEPDVHAALTADEVAVRSGLARWLRAAQAADQVRTDLSADRLAGWVALVLDGFLGQVASNAGFTVEAEAAVLRETVLRLVGASS